MRFGQLILNNKKYMASITALTTSTTAANSMPIINTNFTNLNTDKAEIGGQTFTGAVDFSGTTNSGLKVNSLTTVERDALTPANGMIIYNTTDTEFEFYEAGSWVDLAGVSDASTTVKGVVEEATDAELAAGTAAGGTSARLFAGGASFNETAAAGKVPVAESTGQIGEDWVGLTTAGDLMYTDGTDLTRLGIGTANQILQTNSGATAPEWSTKPFQTFGGDGSDGALDTTGGTVDIDAGGARFLVRNYTTITVASNALTFSNTHANGTIFIIKATGNVTISDTVNLDGTGAAGGAGGAGTGAAGADGIAADNWQVVTQDGTEIEGQNGINNGAGGVGGVKQFSPPGHYISMALKPGSGGGGAGSGDDAIAAGGAGGAGGGAVLIECGGALNFTGTITADGVVGSVGTAGASNGGGGGGGGAGGSVMVIYNTLTDKSGTITITGGTGGAGAAGSGGNQGGSGGGGAGSSVSAGGAGGAAGAGAASGGSTATIGGVGGAPGGGSAAGGGGGGGASGWSTVVPYINPETT